MFDASLFDRLESLVTQISNDLSDWRAELELQALHLKDSQEEVNRRNQELVGRSNAMLSQVASIRKERDEMKKTLAMAEKTKIEAQVAQRKAEVLKFQAETEAKLLGKESDTPTQLPE